MKYIQVESDFPVENRPIFQTNTAYLNYNNLGLQETHSKIALDVDNIMTFVICVKNVVFSLFELVLRLGWVRICISFGLDIANAVYPLAYYQLSLQTSQVDLRLFSYYLFYSKTKHTFIMI